MQKVSTLREVKILYYFLLSLIFLTFFTGKIVAQNTTITVQSSKDITINCSDNIPVAMKPIATTSCKGEGGLTFSMQETTQGLCPRVIIRLWTVGDPCGNKVISTQKIYIFDNTAPVISGIPADITVSCTEIPKMPTTVLAKDKCDDKVQLYVKDTKFAMSCDFTYKIRREFTAIDRCGNIQKQAQIITVQDKKAPVFVTVLQNVTVSCANIPTAVKPIATDNCSAPSSISIYLTENRTGLGCKDSYTIRRVWTAKDQCGNTTAATQYITVRDTEKPVFANIPQSVTLECNELVPAATNLTAKDNCDLQVDILLKNTVKYGTCSDNYQILREWTAVDNCNNKNTITQSVTVKDTKKPVFSTLLKDVTVECGVNTNVNPLLALSLSARDNCDPSVTLAFSEVLKQTECNTTLTRTYTATDNCFNVAVQTQVISIKDTTPPSILGEAKDVTIDCAAVTAAPLFLAKDNCDPQATVQFLEEKILGNCPDNYQLKRTWVATDKCGNKTTKVQIITVNDIKQPTLLNIPADATMSCDNLRIAATVIAEDNCDKNVEVIFSEINIPNATCGYVVKRTWTAIDNCANSNVKTQTISVIDTEKPVLIVPANVSVECENIPPVGNVSATDNCDRNVEIRLFEVRKAGICANNFTILRTWTATDKCGNINVQTQNITVLDTKKPIFSNVPNDLTVGDCNFLPISPNSVTATDNCTGNVTVSFNEINNTTQGCVRKIQRIWTATDACLNSVSAVQNIYIQDGIAPTFSGEINDVTISCSDAVPVNPQPVIKDNCDKEVTINFKEITEILNCNTLIKRTWIATDICANSAIKVQNITMIDTIKPVFQPIIADVTVECGTAPALPNVVATDNCDKQLTISFKEEVTNTGGACNSKVTRTWIATDKCGNSSVIKQTIWIKDSEVPVFVQTPAAITVDCSQLTTIAKPIVKDNCTDKILFTFKDEANPIVDPNDTCSIFKIRTWTATDLCGNTASATQNITITDKIAPIVAIAPKDAYVFCSDTIPAKPKLSFFDACNATISVVYNEKTIIDTVKNDGSYVIERKWVASDRCGNAKVVIQNIYVSKLDIKPPVLLTAGMLDEMTLECSDLNANNILQNPIFPQAKDDCDDNVQVTFTDEKVLETCGSNAYIILRTWKATDDAGNTDEFQQFFNITDKTAPVIYNVPQDITIACGTTPPLVPDNIFAIDTCGAIMRSDLVEVSFYEVAYPGSCPNGVGQIKRFWTAIDSCDNVANKTQVITFSTSIISKVLSNNTLIKDFADRKEIQEIREEKIKVFPNPTSGTTYISLPKNADKMLIVNELGQVKYTVDNPKEGINIVEMRDWNTGIYIVQIKMHDKIQTQKLFLQTH